MSILEQSAQRAQEKQKAQAYDDMMRRQYEEGLAGEMYRKGMMDNENAWQDSMRQEYYDVPSYGAGDYSVAPETPIAPMQRAVDSDVEVLPSPNTGLAGLE